MPETVILVHGIWMSGLELGLLAWRLRRWGFRTRLFRYPSLRRPPADNAVRLIERVRRQGDTTVHLIGHSLGGLVILHALQREPELIGGRVVLLGSPVNGSRIAQRLVAHRILRWLIGRSGPQGLLGDGPAWCGTQPPGVIAGTRPFGVGRLLGGFDGTNDGTVALSETRLDGAQASLSFPTTHFGLLFSRPAARAVCAFLRTGGFTPAGESL